MQVKKFRATSMKEALDQIKKELGPDALIIESRKVRRKGIVGFFQQPQIEVTAVLERKSSSEPIFFPKKQPVIKEPILDEETKKEIEKLKEMVEIIKKETALTTLTTTTKKESTSSSMEPLNKIKNRLTSRGMSLEAVDIILRDLILEGVDLNSVQAIEEGLRKSLIKSIPIENVEDSSFKNQNTTTPKVIFLVGTTGVGKTTTIAKLAAKYHLLDGKKVGLITIDTYRIAAVEQLKTYAEIINIPLEVAFDSTDYQKALRRFDDMDIVFVDTAGRSQHNLIQVRELSEFIETKKPNEIHLVISATSKLEDCKSIIAAFMPLGVTHIIYSKADETIEHGSLFDLIRVAKVPVSFVANGQRVPEDLQVGSTDLLLDLLLEN